jgi:hypothetical protein
MMISTLSFHLLGESTTVRPKRRRNVEVLELLIMPGRRPGILTAANKRQAPHSQPGNALATSGNERPVVWGRVPRVRDADSVHYLSLYSS